MKKMTRFAFALAVCVAGFGVSSLIAGPKSVPAPPPPVMCGCICPDGSFTTTHAPDANSCPAACATACQGAEEM